jgi:hypothetical protein
MPMPNYMLKIRHVQEDVVQVVRLNEKIEMEIY